MTTLLLVLLALLPVALLLYLIMYMDRNEREPMGLVLKAMMLGALGFIPAVLVETALGWVPFPGRGSIVAALWDSFVKIAPIEELVKMAPVFLLAWGHPQFNEENDGIVYAGASALGFAAVENLFYVLSKGFAVGAARAVTSLPLHCFAGLVMGFYIGRARFATSGPNKLVALGFLWAYLAHSVYDFLVLSKSLLALAMLPMVAALVFIGLGVLRKGRAMSLARTPAPAVVGTEGTATVGAQEEKPMAAIQAPPPADTPQVPAKKQSHAWKAVVGRVLLGICLAFWTLMAIGLVQQKEPATLPKALAGGALITFIPILIGLLLEFSYWSGRRALKAAATGHA